MWGLNLCSVSTEMAIDCSLVRLSCQVSARKLKPHPPRPRSLHERLLEDIKAERKLRPVSPDMIRRSRLGKPLTADERYTHVYMLTCMHKWLKINGFFATPEYNLNKLLDVLFKLSNLNLFVLLEGILPMTFCMAALYEPYQGKKNKH